MKRFLVAGLIIAASLAGTFAPTTQAAEDSNESIALSPVNKRYVVDAGSTTADKLTIINDGKTDYDILIYARPYTVTNEEYNPDFTRTTDSTEVYQWVRLNQTKFSLKAGQSVEVPYSMYVPANAKSGGHYGVIFAETQPSDQVSGNAVVRKKRVGSVIYATVKGNLVTNGKVSDLTLPFWQMQPPLSSSARVTNNGTTDFTDKVTMTVRDIFGQEKYKSEKEYPVLPQTTRKINLEWSDANWFGLYKAEVQHQFLDKSEQKSSYVLMMPRYIPVLALIALVLVVVYALYRRSKKH